MCYRRPAGARACRLRDDGLSLWELLHSGSNLLGKGLSREVTHVDGFEIGLGHPVSTTGARTQVSLLYEMKRRDVTLGLANLCVGGGRGVAVILEWD